MTKASEQFIERVGLSAEADGLTRIAGRLFGALLLSERPRSLDELAEQLGVSKASVSTDARRLLERGIVQRVGKPGDRRDYYQLVPDFLVRVIRHRVRRWSEFHELALEVREADAMQADTVRERLDYIDAIHAFVLTRLDEALREWEARGLARLRPRAGAQSGHRPPRRAQSDRPQRGHPRPRRGEPRTKARTRRSA